MTDYVCFSTRAPPQQPGNLIDLLERSLELSMKAPKKVNAPPLQAALPKAKKK